MKIYITRGDQRAGPYNLAQINAFLNIGRLKLEDYAWYEGCVDWIKVKGVPGIKMVSSGGQQSLSTPNRSAPVAARTQTVTPTPDRIRPAPRRHSQQSRIPCRICESGELVKTSLRRFSRSLHALGVVLLLLSTLCIGVIFLALIPIDTSHHDMDPISIKIGNSDPTPVNLAAVKPLMLILQKSILANWQFLFLFSFAGFILFFLFRSRKQVLQCNHCESVVAIE